MAYAKVLQSDIEAARSAVRQALQVLSTSEINLRHERCFVCVAVEDVFVVTSTLEAQLALFEEIIDAYPPF